MKICWRWCELKLLLADIARSVRLSEEVTRVGQHFGALTIDSADALVRRDQQMLLAAGLTLRHRFDKLERCRFEVYERLLSLVVAADLTKGSERIAADRLLLISSIDLGESAGEVEESNAIVGVVTTGFECLPPSCDGLTGPDDYGPMISRLIDRGALGNQAGQSGSSAGRSPRP
ncbi:hypothetical protein F511_41742 [Dorcoceras hygrometricum]|uniref:Uncharacterized protein n=1 Tax=Dorcoceras hygrometricum TaxID=472368 RepID=A0A2Z7D300_9LAMI|nr:hypothetical protein F511_41742 [Dorcoceras hygrometricum]